jgi:integrase
VQDYTATQLTEFCLGNGIAPGTIRARRTSVTSCFDWLAWRGFVPVNPASDLKFTVKTDNMRVREGHWLTETEVAHVIRCASERTHPLMRQRDRLVLMFGFLMGLRRHEICGPINNWDRFSPDLSRVSFVGKGRKMAQLGVPPQLRAELASWRLVQPAGTSIVFPRFHMDAHPMWDVPLSVDGVHFIVKAAGEAAGVPNIAAHDMRRSFAGILEQKGVPVTDISRLLRHSNVGITSTYLDSNPNKVASLGDVIEFNLGAG